MPLGYNNALSPIVHLLIYYNQIILGKAENEIDIMQKNDHPKQ